MAAQGPQRIIFRADASREIGGGHVMRCLTLADHFRAVGWSVGFATIAESLNVVPRLKSVAELLVSPDARALDAAALQSRWPSGCDVFVVDHYSLDAAYERSWRAFARHIVVIDDLANRPHDCDLLIDSNFGRQAGDYTALVPADALLLIGAGYAMLRPEFATHRAEALARRAMLKKVDRILVSLGLTDIGGITARIVQALIEIEGTFSIDVVIGYAAASRPVLEEIAAKTPRVFLHVDPPDMAALMSDADLAIGAGGTTSWERCCLGLPTLVLTLADNQRLLADNLEKSGAAVLHSSETDIEHFKRKLANLVTDLPTLKRMAKAAASIVDGCGAQRISIAIHRLDARRLNAAAETSQIAIRAATVEDSRLVWAWRNDPVTRANSRNTDIISWADHEAWFKKALESSRRVMLIGVCGSEPVGIVRFDQVDNSAFEVNINLAQEKRSTGLGTELLVAACATLNGLSPQITLFAHIRAANVGSRRLFERCQFELFSEGREFVVYRRVASSLPATARPESSAEF